MTDTVRLIATVNSMREGNAAYRRFADPETYRPLWGEERGDEGAGRRLTYAVEVSDREAIDRFREQDNVFRAEEDVRAYGIPEPLPPRLREVEPGSLETQVPEEAVLRYASVGPKFQEMGLDGTGSVYPDGLEVAVLDTGIDRVWAERMGTRLMSTAQFTDEPHGAILPAGVGHMHGTHCSGILCAGNKLRLNKAQVLADDGWGYTSWIMDGLYWAIRSGCRVVSMSLGGGSYSQQMADAVAYARTRGVLVVCAMGNDGRYLKSYPAAYPGATAVIASSYTDSLRASFSNYGEWAHGTTDGVQVLSWVLDGYLGRASGTSMATPLYARALALLIAEYGSPSTTLKVAGATAKDTPEPAIEEGYGRISGLAAARELARLEG